MALTKVQTIGIETGISLTGVTTVVTLNASGNVTAVDGTFTGNVSVAGTLTYEDVTNVDSVGLITARNGVSVTGGDFKVGSATTISQDNIFTTGIVTATSFYGDGSNLTGITQIVTGDTSVQTTDTGSDGTIKFNTDGSEVARIDSSGRVLVGMSSATSNKNTVTPTLAVSGSGVNGAAQIVRHTSVGGGGALLELSATRGTSATDYTILQSGDGIGTVDFLGTDGNEYVVAANILAQVDGTPGDNDMPGRLVFSTTADGASSPTERMRIGNDGALYVGSTSALDSTNGFYVRPYASGRYVACSSDGVHAAVFNRNTDDGSIVDLRQAGTTEGTISVSGTTVSYNGAHLARWSQLPGGVERTEILRGSVLSNIDEMCEWGEEENEQLNRMKVSDVEGDKNVSGVFQSWDDDDDTYTNDFYCAMTGDFVIRIAQGVTVERGDLLMSAGDGTAKPQDDDIIRSKTIAKVTSTHVTCTYDDGSYCVPCVLMAC